MVKFKANQIRKQVVGKNTRIALLATIAAILLASAFLPALGRSGSAVAHVRASASSDPIATGNWQQDQYDSIIVPLAQQNGLNPFVIKGQIMLESGFNTWAVSMVINWSCGGTHDEGLMQINPYCSGQWNGLFDAWTNINYGTQSMGSLLRQFGDISLALQAYNIGAGSVQAGQRNWGYSSAVLNWAQTFQNEHNNIYGYTPPTQSSGSSGSGGWTYTVHSGDYLYALGQRFGVNWQSIAQANGIYSPYIIYPGEQLTIP